MAHDDLFRGTFQWIRTLQRQLAAQKKKVEKLEGENAQLRSDNDACILIIDGEGYREAFALIDELEKKVEKLSRHIHILKDALRASRNPSGMVWGDRPEMWGEE